MIAKPEPLILDLARVAQALRAALAIIAPDGRLPSDFEEQLHAAAQRAMDRGDLDTQGLTEQGLERLRSEYGIRRY